MPFSTFGISILENPDVVGQRLPVYRLRAYVHTPTLCLDVVDEDLHLFQGVAYDFMLDIFLVVSQFYFSLNLLRGSDGCTAQAS